MGDRIETGTFCILAALTKGNLLIKNFKPKLIQTELSFLKKVGASVKTFKNEIQIKGPKQIKSINNISTKEYPGFPTDLQAQFMVFVKQMEWQIMKKFFKMIYSYGTAKIRCKNKYANNAATKVTQV